jgi:hypothetical protein
MQSSYTDEIGLRTVPVDYLRPRLLRFDTTSVIGAERSGAHWSTTYGSSFPFIGNTPQQVKKGQTMPSTPALSHIVPKSAYAIDFAPPSDLIAKRNPGQLPILRNDLCLGTSKYAHR